MTKPLFLHTALAALLCAAAPAFAQSTDLRTWTAAGDVLLSANGSAATLSTAYADEAPLSTGSALLFDELETALALQPGSLAADTIEGSGLQQSFNAAAGSVLRFDWRLDTTGFDTAQADRAFVLIDGATLVALGTVGAAPLAGRFSHSFTDAGPHALAIVVMDVNAADKVSTLNISGLQVSAVPEPGQWALLLAGVAGLGALARRRAAQAKR